MAVLQTALLLTDELMSFRAFKMPPRFLACKAAFCKSKPEKRREKNSRIAAIQEKKHQTNIYVCTKKIHIYILKIGGGGAGRGRG